jgi:hypothetical protein
MKMADDNSIAFYNDGPVNELCDHAHAFNFKAECTAGHFTSSLSHELMTNLTINVA